MNQLVERLPSAKSRGKGQWIARCPAHDDKSPSLAIREEDDGRILIKCFAGCEAIDIVHAVGLQLSDLFPTPPAHQLAPFAFAQKERSQKDRLNDRVRQAKTFLAILTADIKAGKQVRQEDIQLGRRAKAFLQSQEVS